MNHCEMRMRTGLLTDPSLALPTKTLSGLLTLKKKKLFNKEEIQIIFGGEFLMLAMLGLIFLFQINF